MKRFALLLIAALIVGCGSTNELDTVAGGSRPNTAPTPAPYAGLDAATIRVFGLASVDVLGRPTGADLDGASRFTDLVAPLFDFNTPGPGPLGGTVAVTPGPPRSVVFSGFKTTGGATVNGTVLVNPVAGLQTYRDLEFRDATGKVVTVNGTIQITPSVESPTVSNLVVTSNLKLDFGNGSILTLTNHVSRKRLEGTAPENYIITFNDTAEVRIQQGEVDYHALQTMPEPFVSAPTGPQSGVILLTGIAPSRESLRLEVIEGQRFEVYLQMSPDVPFMLVATI